MTFLLRAFRLQSSYLPKIELLLIHNFFFKFFNALCKFTNIKF